MLSPSNANIFWFLPACGTTSYSFKYSVDVKKKWFGTYTYNRLLGDKSPFSQQNLHGDGVDRDEETGRIQCKCSYFLVFKSPIACSQPSIQAFFFLWVSLWFVQTSAFVCIEEKRCLCCVIKVVLFGLLMV